MNTEKTAQVSNPDVRHEFVLLFDVTNGNPNGDPDAANSPRIDPQTLKGLVTDVAIKRKIRDYLQLAHQVPMFIQSKVALNELKEEKALKVQPPLSKEEKEGKKAIPRLRDDMAQGFYDIRMFGAVLATGEAGAKYNAGQVRGPMQVTFASSIDAVFPIDLTITRVAITRKEDALRKDTEMARKSILPYGLYRAHGFFNPLLGKAREEGGTGVTSGDLQLFWEALVNLFDLDRSASRGEMAVRGLYVFSHENALGKAPAHKLFKLVDIPALSTPEKPASPRSFEEYTVSRPPEGALAEFPGVTLTVLTEG
ncbi:type I-C CRISPR-associated protein Cas7/Csd2 [Deinococcus wulumuqiensis]|uniref:Type I-C CRISPR-associated protein Cas7/Csd2 n=1 Tax=Deinococcus wulumuqiensis TaxID=980427 RepID=A0AAV4K4W9_9DEIO|nr:type I-C CRISPR-associated protein Cas7/Csd2 [Deinococcus wulumuqiensis]QII22431.1 type I-C CRISPR-associated protein Cas7/Csd2 [Deinococcus wulumuqiensis R12]GGI85628.1 type I-C CRISPR-associated protein Cas7/Csd2 [Deinococcus wulumuqiensis]GGP30152.1 type I-C CRISPR-associated protein Cas7/Csd2 [Deinococcus wulumuqiensis]